ncbi:MAG TPA: immunity protein Tsi6 family protein [Bryobacteraceae bacterium]|nr:immunity protein Tsi6 family protein [Bryobacteraceae bacterium]
MSNFLLLLEDGQKKCNRLLSQYPTNTALQSVAKQIEYLIGLESGSNSDRSRLKDITIGVLTAREIEPLDDDAAETFYQISSTAKRM